MRLNLLGWLLGHKTRYTRHIADAVEVSWVIASTISAEIAIFAKAELPIRAIIKTALFEAVFTHLANLGTITAILASLLSEVIRNVSIAMRI